MKDQTPYKNKSVPLNLSISNQNSNKRDNSVSKKSNSVVKGSIPNGLDDRLNFSLDISNGGKSMGPGMISNVENNLKLSRISEEKLNNSMDIGGLKQESDQLTDKSIIRAAKDDL